MSGKERDRLKVLHEVRKRHLTQKQLDQLVAFQVHSAQVAKQKIPAAGTATYKTQVVDPILQRMITNAQVENIAKELGVTVSDSEVNAGLQIQKRVSGKGVQSRIANR